VTVASRTADLPSGERYYEMPFHVFLSHSSADKPAVEELARRLAKERIHAWLDKWHLIPGDPLQPAIEKALAESETCASLPWYFAR
jgi:aromatic ring-cleaving dioxygenase